MEADQDLTSIETCQIVRVVEASLDNAFPVAALEDPRNQNEKSNVVYEEDKTGK